MKLRLQPIRVFCFHQVSDTFDEQTCYREDWLQTDVFKNEIQELCRQGYIFISLPDAYDKLREDRLRRHKYAVLTADDGDASLRNVLPWLNEKQIPITLFLNPKYLDGKHFRHRETEQYLSEFDVQQLHVLYPLLTIGSHGWEHIDALRQTDQEFIDSFSRSVDYLNNLPNYIPFFAYPYGHCSYQAYDITIKHQIVPILVRGSKNYMYNGYIDRELLGIHH